MRYLIDRFQETRYTYEIGFWDTIAGVRINKTYPINLEPQDLAAGSVWPPVAGVSLNSIPELAGSELVTRSDALQIEQTPNASGQIIKIVYTVPGGSFTDILTYPTTTATEPSLVERGPFVSAANSLTRPVYGLLTVDTVFDNLPYINPTNNPRVYCAGYWSTKDQGGGTFEWDSTSTKTADGGRVFASTITPTGRWLRRTKESPTVLEYGAIPQRNLLPDFGGSYYKFPPSITNDVITAISTKFTTLALAQAWWGTFSVTALTDSIDACAIQATLENNTEVRVPEGLYTINKAIKLPRGRRFIGGGYNTSIKCVGCSGIIPHGTAPTNTGNVLEAYTNNSYVGHMSWYGDGNKTSTPADLCGINFPNDITLAYNNNSPQVYLTEFEHLTFAYFRGHGVKILNEFNTTLRFIYTYEVAGHGIYLQGGNTTSLHSCYPNNCRTGYSGYRIWTKATLNSCNGNDTADNPWATFGALAAETGTTYSRYNITMIGCNIEGSNKSVVLTSTGALTMINCYFQARLIASDPFFIFDESTPSDITLINTDGQTISAVAPVAAIKNSSGSPTTSKYTAIGLRDNNDFPLKVKYTDVTGVTNLFGTSLPAIANMDTAYADTGLPALRGNILMTTRFYLGDANQNARIAQGVGSPNGVVTAPIASLYINMSGGAGTSLWVKETGNYTNTGWVAK